MESDDHSYAHFPMRFGEFHIQKRKQAGGTSKALAVGFIVRHRHKLHESEHLDARGIFFPRRGTCCRSFAIRNGVCGLPHRFLFACVLRPIHAPHGNTKPNGAETFGKSIATERLGDGYRCSSITISNRGLGRALTRKG